MKSLISAFNEFRESYSLERIGHLYFWNDSDKAKFISDATCLVFLTGTFACTVLYLFPYETLNIDRNNLVWAGKVSAVSAVVFFLLRLFAVAVKSSDTYSKLALILNTVALAVCLPLLFSCLGMFDGFCWLLLFVYAAVGFVVLEQRYIIRTQLATLIVMISITLFHDVFPYRVRAYMVGQNSFVDQFSAMDLVFLWVLMCLSSVIGMVVLAYLTTKWQRREEDLRVISAKDELTGIMNRRSIIDFLDRHFQNSVEQLKELSVAMIDLDHFKHINDTYGHPFGDKALKLVSKTVDELIRKQDAVGRYGGEEFLLVFSECTAEHASRKLNELREVLQKQSLTADSGEAVTIRLSAGVTSLRHDDKDYALLIDRADAALYKAKEQGRDQVVSD